MIDNPTIVNVLVIVSIIFISTAFHELMHAYTALKLGDDLAYLHGRISLNPLKHIDPFLTIILPGVMLLMGLPPILAAKPVPINPNRVSGRENGMALVGIAGPLTNLFLAAVISLLLRATNPAGFIGDFLFTFVSINVSLFLFNMMPIPPLDGSRLLYAFAPSSVQQVMDRIEGFGIFSIVLILSLLLPVFGPVLSSLHTSIMQILLG